MPRSTTHSPTQRCARASCNRRKSRSAAPPRNLPVSFATITTNMRGWCGSSTSGHELINRHHQGSAGDSYSTILADFTGTCPRSCCLPAVREGAKVWSNIGDPPKVEQYGRFEHFPGERERVRSGKRSKANDQTSFWCNCRGCRASRGKCWIQWANQLLASSKAHSVASLFLICRHPWFGTLTITVTSFSKSAARTAVSASKVEFIPST